MSESLQTTRVFDSLPDRHPVEPTFYLGGQPYVYDERELVKAGPELAQHAFIETRDQLVRLAALHHSGMVVPEDGEALTREDYTKRATELCAGLAALVSILHPYVPYARRTIKGIGMLAGYMTGLVLVPEFD